MKGIGIVTVLVLVLVLAPFWTGCNESCDRPVEEDIKKILTDLRMQTELAENNGDIDTMSAMFDDEIIVMAPGFPTVVGADAVTEFMKDFFDTYDVRIQYNSEEILVSGNWAFDRGTASHVLTPKDGGDDIRELGKYLWLYRYTDHAGWRGYRIIWNATGPWSATETP
jgi:ketosteroid isomerase-like protein